ncbi:hypothetical protein ACFSDD_13750 [Salipiger marinus]|uniref:hypothetical protein n=1 Tax=Salipiger marinus TaxID=555512 RepID=UPI002C624BA0|nr:hypothetical protein [Salipiger manganoxidans]MEB3419047.1 hypothetical protein [Salipiger manganoxidans]
MSFMMLAPLMLDTAADAQQASATFGRVNATWRSLADLYGATQACEPGTTCAARSPTPGLPNGYRFETVSSEVQSPKPATSQPCCARPKRRARTVRGR